MNGGTGLIPATPQACLRLLKHYGFPLEGKRVALVGRGRTVGQPLYHLLQRENATVTVCHSRTRDLAFHLRQAELAILAAGRPNLVTKEMAHPELVVVDAGISAAADGGIAGDASADVSKVAAALTPVPGGVGTLTTAMLFENLLKAMDWQTEGAMRK